MTIISTIQAPVLPSGLTVASYVLSSLWGFSAGSGFGAVSRGKVSFLGPMTSGREEMAVSPRPEVPPSWPPIRDTRSEN